MFKNINTFILLVFTLIMASCVKDIDFDQAKNISISPVVVASLVFIEEPANRFVGLGAEILTIRDSINDTQILNDQFLIDNLVKVELLFETTNSINRAFQIDVEFFNDAFVLQETYSFTVSESPLNNEIISEHIKTFQGNSLVSLEATTQIVFTLTLLPSNDGSILNEKSPGIIRLNSKATFYFNIDSSS